MQSPVSNAPLAQGDYIVASSTAQGAAYDRLLGQFYDLMDQTITPSGSSVNSQRLRRCVFVKNGSGSSITPGMGLNFMSGQFGKNVQACPAGSPIRCFAPAYVRGLTTTVIPDGAYFLAVMGGPTSPLSDGTAISIGDQLVIGAASGRVRTNYGLGGGLVFAQVAASTVLTNTTVATKFDQNYTFPANSLNAGDVIRVYGEVMAILGNSTNTLLLELMLGSQVIATFAAWDVTDAGGDIGTFQSDITIRTAGASGTMIASSVMTKNVNGTVTTYTALLGTLGAGVAIDTTATQQLAIRGTWSASSPSNQARQDVLNISRINTNAPGLPAGVALAAAAGGGTPVQFSAQVNCQW